jgi:hypothetical protein
MYLRITSAAMKPPFFLFILCPSALFAQFSMGPAARADFNNYRMYGGLSLGDPYVTSNTIGWSAGLQMRMEINHVFQGQSGVYTAESYLRPFINTSRGLLERTRIKQVVLPVIGGMRFVPGNGFQPEFMVGWHAIWRSAQTEFFSDRVVRAGDQRSWPDFALLPIIQLGLSKELGKHWVITADYLMRFDMKNRTDFNTFTQQQSLGIGLRRKVGT